MLPAVVADEDVASSSLATSVLGAAVAEPASSAPVLPCVNVLAVALGEVCQMPVPNGWRPEVCAASKGKAVGIFATAPVEAASGMLAETVTAASLRADPFPSLLVAS